MHSTRRPSEPDDSALSASGVDANHMVQVEGKLGVLDADRSATAIREA